MIVLYPILIIVAAVMLYILGKKNGTVKEVTNTIQLPPLAIEETNLYQDETEEQFILRCQNFITNYCNLNNLQFLVSDNIFQLDFEAEDGSSFNIVILPFYQPYRYISFGTRISLIMIADDKLYKVAELINRLNTGLFLNGLYLNYETRHVEYSTVYYIGDIKLIDGYLDFNLNMNFKAIALRNLVNRVALANEEPVLVALDF